MLLNVGVIGGLLCQSVESFVESLKFLLVVNITSEICEIFFGLVLNLFRRWSPNDFFEKL